MSENKGLVVEREEGRVVLLQHLSASSGIIPYPFLLISILSVTFYLISPSFIHFLDDLHSFNCHNHYSHLPPPLVFTLKTAISIALITLPPISCLKCTPSRVLSLPLNPFAFVFVPL